MRVVLPLFGTRVAPRCLVARHVVLAEIALGEVVSRRTLEIAIHDEDDLIERLLELRVDLLVCGGIRREFMSDLADNGVDVINNVAGEVDQVIEVLCGGRLSPGYGLRGSSLHSPEPPGGSHVPASPQPTIDCMSCSSRACTRGEPCTGLFPPVQTAILGTREERFLTVGQDVSAESDPRLCRIAELIHFILGMDVHRVGLAYCWELFREVEVLVPILSRHFEVVPVCCRVGTNGAAPDRLSGSRETPTCRPDLQAALLEEAKTEINVMAGLCIGCDLLFANRSHVPVTTLFVRDRVLAHNPMAALHTRYYLDQIESRRQRRATPDADFPAGVEDR